MSWINELIDLYEKNSDKIGVIEYRRDIPYVLLPLFIVVQLSRQKSKLFIMN